jgi:hypothetical protein
MLSGMAFNCSGKLWLLACMHACSSVAMQVECKRVNVAALHDTKIEVSHELKERWKRYNRQAIRQNARVECERQGVCGV